MMNKKTKRQAAHQTLLLRAIGGSKITDRLIAHKQELAQTRVDPEKYKAMINFGLPEITDLDGPAEC